jgi:hypothetical protein
MTTMIIMMIPEREGREHRIGQKGNDDDIMVRAREAKEVTTMTILETREREETQERAGRAIYGLGKGVNVGDNDDSGKERGGDSGMLDTQEGRCVVRAREAKEVTTMTPEREREETLVSRARRMATTMTLERERVTTMMAMVRQQGRQRK